EAACPAGQCRVRLSFVTSGRPARSEPPRHRANLASEEPNPLVARGGTMLSRVLAVLLITTAGVALAQEPVQIGVITSITGRFAEFGEQHQAGVQIALEDVNAAGGINGAPVEVIWEDDTSEVN